MSGIRGEGDRVGALVYFREKTRPKGEVPCRYQITNEANRRSHQGTTPPILEKRRRGKANRETNTTFSSKYRKK